MIPISLLDLFIIATVSILIRLFTRSFAIT